MRLSHLEMALFLTSANWWPGAISLSLASTRLSHSHPQLYGTHSHLAESVYVTDSWDVLPAQCGAWFLIAAPNETLSANYWWKTGEVTHFIASSPFHELFSLSASCSSSLLHQKPSRTPQCRDTKLQRSWTSTGCALPCMFMHWRGAAAALVGVLFWWRSRK